MHHLKNIFLYFFFSFLIPNGFSQNPAHFILGESELAGVHVYDILQDNNLNYWISSNNGLYKYDGYQFQHILCRDMLSPSLFNLKQGKDHEIFCNNLSGQIFRIFKDSCSVFYEIPDTLVSTVIDFTISPSGRFYISTSCVFELLPDKSIKFISNFRYDPGEFYETENGLIHLIGMDNQLEIKGGALKETGYHEFNYTVIDSSQSKISKMNHIKVGDDIYMFECFTGYIYKIQHDTLRFVSQLTENNNKYRIFSIDDKFWIPNSTLGLTQFDQLTHPNTGQIQLFKDYKISALMQDNEKNILLGTFNEGIIVIPKTQITNLDLGPFKDKISLLSKGTGDELIFGTNNGRLGSISIDHKITSFYQNLGSAVEFLGNLTHHNQYLVGGQRNILTKFIEKDEIEIYLGSIKDMVPITKGQYLFACNTGAQVFNPSGQVYNPFKAEKEILRNYFITSLYSSRSYSIGYDSLNYSIYVGTSLGLKRLKSDTIESLQLDGQEILARDILYHNGRVYIASNKQGVLVYQNDQLVDHWTANNELVSNITRQLITNNTYFFLNTDKGIQILTTNGETKWYLNKSDGLITDHVIDMVCSEDYLWLLNQRGLQRVDLAGLKSSDFAPNIRFNSIKISDLEITDFNKVGEFNHDQNKFEVDFGSMSLKNRNEIVYHYRLLGVENHWQISQYMDHQLDYKTLPPGEYNFQVRAVWRNTMSEAISYRFVIFAPFWTKWWFYAVIFVITFSLIFIYFYRKMLQQRRKSELQQELYESKMTAIQAQMNPHFIFNSLNSIQDLVLKNDAENAYNYISKFALLVRNTLTFSDKDFIDFSDEIGSLRLYLSLEKLRFKQAFEYTVEAPDDVEIQIPPMLIQPFIENSLVHGLLHKDGQKLLTVNFVVFDEVICTITDNGIGRKEAKLIQERQFTNHESFALSAIKKRLAILELRYGGTYTVNYYDLMDGEGSAGTKVVIRIPFVKNY